MKEYLDELKNKNKELKSRKEGETEAVDVKEEKEHGWLYWMFVNIGKRSIGFWKKHKILGTLLGFLLLYILFIGRSAYQPAFIWIRRYFLLVLLLLALALWFRRMFKRSVLKGKIISTVSFLALLAIGIFLGRQIYEYLGLYTHYKQLNKVELSALPQTDHERIQPLNSVATLVRQESLSETEAATSPRFTRRQDGSYDFSMAVGPSPKYKVQQFSKDLYRVISVSATAPAPNFSAENQHDAKFDVGELLIFSRRTKNAVIRSMPIWRYFNYEPVETYFIENDEGEFVQVTSLVKWKGLLIPRPVFGGVTVINQLEKRSFGNTVKRILFGKGKYIKPVDIGQYAYLKGQNLVPEKVSRFTANSYRFQEGFLAPIPGYHEGDIRIPVLKTDQNAMPFVAYFIWDDVNDAENKLYHFYGLEPFEKDKHGLNSSVFIPADGLGKVYYMDHAKRQDAYIGSSAVGSKIIESRKNYDWSKNNAVEFRPFIKRIDGKTRFFWLSTVVTKTDESGESFIGGSIPEVTITDARYSQVVWINRDNLPDTKRWNNQISDELRDYWGESRVGNVKNKEFGEHEGVTSLSKIDLSDNDPIRYSNLLIEGIADTVASYPLEYWLGHKDIDTLTKLLLQREFAVSNDKETFSIMDSILTENTNTRPLYIYSFNKIMAQADGALAELVGEISGQFLVNNPCAYFKYVNTGGLDSNVELWEDFLGFALGYSIKYPEGLKVIDSKIENCNEHVEEWSILKTKLLARLKP